MLSPSLWLQELHPSWHRSDYNEDVVWLYWNQDRFSLSRSCRLLIHPWRKQAKCFLPGQDSFGLWGNIPLPVASWTGPVTSHFPFVAAWKKSHVNAIFPLYMSFTYSTLVTLKMAILHCFSTLPFHTLPFHSSYWPGPGSIYLKHNLSLITCNNNFLNRWVE